MAQKIRNSTLIKRLTKLKKLSIEHDVVLKKLKGCTTWMKDYTRRQQTKLCAKAKATSKRITKGIHKIFTIFKINTLQSYQILYQSMTDSQFLSQVTFRVTEILKWLILISIHFSKLVLVGFDYTMSPPTTNRYHPPPPTTS